MTITEILSEAFDQSAADKALMGAMTEIAKRIRPRVQRISELKAQGQKWNIFAQNMYSDFYPLYSDYMRKAFHSSDVKLGFTDAELAALLKKYPEGRLGSNLYVTHTPGWKHFYRNDRTKVGNNKKIYVNLDPSMSINQLEKIINRMTEWLGSDMGGSFGFFGFKIPDSDYDTEADTLVAYIRGDADVVDYSEAQITIQSIAGNTQRIKHRGIHGTDNREYRSKYGVHKINPSSESDSTMLVSKFVDYCIEKIDTLKIYFDKYDDKTMANILAQTWKTKFEAKDWQKL